ncbi:Protein spartin [Frankliniella fusca]|uniref:Protein spartin n=1 Tax=Frankliniella fusca TaxID=407009 RepID=A0AAE1GXH6_9NEOP|nr:Protein spartin [Frankliniella fusca]
MTGIVLQASLLEARLCAIFVQSLLSRVLSPMLLVIGWLFESIALRTYDAIRGYISNESIMNNRSNDPPGTTSAWQQTFEELSSCNDKADKLLEEAVKLEGQNQQSSALDKYSECLTVIEHALSLPIVCPPKPNLSWERGGIILQKLQKNKMEIKNKITLLQGIGEEAGSSSSSPLQPPSYDEAMGISTPEEAGAVRGVEPVLRTYRELGEALNTLKQAYRSIIENLTSSTDRNRDQVDEASGDAEVIFAYDNVRLYFISPDGTVSSSSEPERMLIVQFTEDNVENRPPAYLQVGTWIYPLVPGVSPCFRTSYRAFILPDIHSDVEGSAVGLILPEDADESVFELLEIILDGIILQLEPEEKGLLRSRREVGLAHSVVRGARWVSSRLISGAERAGDLMNRSTPKILQHIEQEQPKEFSPNVAKGFEVAKSVSGKAVQVTGYVAGKVGLATSALGRFLAPHIQKQGTRLLTNTFKMDEEEAKNKMDNVLEVTAGAVEAFGTVYGALDHSAHILAGSLASNTVTLVKHKYGAQAGQVAGNTFDTVGNVFVASHAIKRLNPKYIAKIAVKETGKAVIDDQRKHLLEDANTNLIAKESMHLGKSD